MLALEVVLSESASAPTFVFDEVDAGVGGKAAVEIGRRLAQLGKSAQVLVVTHLPQVAAFADHHLVVSKQSDGRVTSSGVESLDDTERVRELARMLAGQRNQPTRPLMLASCSTWRHWRKKGKPRRGRATQVTVGTPDSLALRGPIANETRICHWWGRLIARQGPDGFQPWESPRGTRTPCHHAEA